MNQQSNPPASRRAEIAGGGIAGLTLATALAQRGWNVRVHERSPELREIGAGIFIWPNGVTVLEQLGALDEAIVGGSRLECWESLDERFRPMGMAGWLHGTYYSIPRPQLQRALAAAARREGVEIVTGSPVAGADQSALVLESGERCEADLIVGADGIGSRVRASLERDAGMSVRVTDLGVVAQRRLIPRLPEDPIAGSLEFWNGSRRAGVQPVGPDQTYVMMFCRADDHAATREPLNRVTWAESFPKLDSVWARLPDDTVFRPIIDVRCSTWSHGRVVLVGDSAFAMAPNLGQGACATMNAAVALADTLDVVPHVPAALAQWEQRHRKDFDFAQRWSAIYTRTDSRWPERLLPLRTHFIRLAGRVQNYRSRFATASVE